MHSVVETPDYLTDAKDAGITLAERQKIVATLASDPMIGEEIPGTGGARKVRFAGRGKGKSGGYRVITFYSGIGVPVFLLNVFAKGDRIDLTQAQRNDLRRELAALASDYLKGYASMSEAGNRILRSVRHARAYARGEVTRGFVLHVPEAVDVQAIRARLGLSQQAFALRYGFSVAAVRDWEQHRRQPEQAARTLLLVIDRQPEAVDEALQDHLVAA